MANHARDKIKELEAQLQQQQQPTVARSLAKVIAGIGAIKKDRQAGQGKWGYAYRGVDDVMLALQPLLVANNLALLPKYSEFKCEKVTLDGKNGPRDEFFVSVKLDLVFVSTDDGTMMPAISTYGTGIDSGDKAVYKAKSGAFKYALFQALCIPTEEPKDPETDTQQVVHRPLSGDNKLLVEAWTEKLASVKTKEELESCRSEMQALPEDVKRNLYKPYDEAKSRVK